MSIRIIIGVSVTDTTITLVANRSPSPFIGMSQPPMMKSLGRSRTMDALLEDTMTSDLQSSVALSYATVSQV